MFFRFQNIIPIDICRGALAVVHVRHRRWCFDRRRCLSQCHIYDGAAFLRWWCWRRWRCWQRWRYDCRLAQINTWYGCHQTGRQSSITIVAIVDAYRIPFIRQHQCIQLFQNRIGPVVCLLHFGCGQRRCGGNSGSRRTSFGPCTIFTVHRTTAAATSYVMVIGINRLFSICTVMIWYFSCFRLSIVFIVGWYANWTRRFAADTITTVQLVAIVAHCCCIGWFVSVVLRWCRSVTQFALLEDFVYFTLEKKIYKQKVKNGIGN